MTIILKNKDTLIYENFKFRCSIGKKGITYKKSEGDKKTPRGSFSLGSLYFRSDRLKKPETKLNCISIKKNMGWVDDINYPKKYNKIIKLKKNNKFRHEKIFRNDKIYDLLIPINYNTRKIKIGKGSAIFIHLTNNYKKTLGCIALKKKDFLILLKVINKKTKIKIL